MKWRAWAIIGGRCIRLLKISKVSKWSPDVFMKKALISIQSREKWWESALECPWRDCLYYVIPDAFLHTSYLKGRYLGTFRALISSIQVEQRKEWKPAYYFWFSTLFYYSILRREENVRSYESDRPVHRRFYTSCNLYHTTFVPEV